MAPNLIFSATLGFLTAGLIIWLVRRDHLHGKYAVWWLSIAAGFAALGLLPSTIDQIAAALGISYPPILVVILGMSVIVIKMVTMDIERSKSLVKLHRLAQRLAILEGEQRELKGEHQKLENERRERKKLKNEELAEPVD